MNDEIFVPNYYTIQTTFYYPKEGNAPRREIKSNLAKHARSAVLRAIDRMQLNFYGADFCEVFDTNTGESHARIWLNPGGDILIQYRRDSTKYTLGGPQWRQRPQVVASEEE